MESAAAARTLHLVFVLAEGERPAALDRVVARLQAGFAGAAELAATHVTASGAGDGAELAADAVVCLPEAGVDRLPEAVLRGPRRPDALVYLPADAGRVPPGMLSAAAEATGRVVFARYQDVAELERRLESDLRSVLQDRLARSAAAVATYAATWSGGSPYRGLEPYDLEHAPIFFGRGREIEEAIDRLRVAAGEGRPVLLVEGVSGSGKTSLVQAGVTPKLLRPETVPEVGLWRRARLDTAAPDLVAALAESLCAPAALPELTIDGTTADGVAEMLRENPRAAGIVLRGALNLAASERKHKEGLAQLPTARLLLEVDAVERIAAAEEGERDLFLTLLQTLARSGLVWLILTGRDHRIAEHRSDPGWLAFLEGAATYTLPPPNLQELGQIIRQPALAAGYDFEQDPTSGVRLDSLVRETIGRAPGALPLLSLYLDRLFRAGARGGWITFAGYYEVGGFENVLGEHAEAVFASLPEAAQAAFKAVFGRLISVSLSEDERLLVRFGPLADLTADAASRELVEGLVEGRVLVAGLRPDGVAGVVLAHDGLLGQWGRVKKLVEGDREFLLLRARLELDTRRWQRLGQKQDLLLRGGTELQEAETLLRTRAGDLTPEEAAYVRASVEAEAAQRRAMREAKEAEEIARARAAAEAGRAVAVRRTVLTVGTLVTAGVLGAGGWFAWQRIGQAAREAEVARDRQAAAEAAEVAARQARERAEAFATEVSGLALAAATEPAARATLAVRVRAFYGPNATPQSPAEHLLLGVTALEEGRDGSPATLERAAGWLETAARTEATAVLAQLWLAEARWEIGRRATQDRARAEAWAAALAAAKAVKDRAPALAEPRRREVAEALGDLYLRLGRPADAAQAWRERLAAGRALGESPAASQAIVNDVARRLFATTAEPAVAITFLAAAVADADTRPADQARARHAHLRGLLAAGEAQAAVAEAAAWREAAQAAGQAFLHAAALVEEARARGLAGGLEEARSLLNEAEAALNRGRQDTPWEGPWEAWQARLAVAQAIIDGGRGGGNRATARLAAAREALHRLAAAGEATPWDRDDEANLRYAEASVALAARRWEDAKQAAEAALAAGYPVSLRANPGPEHQQRVAAIRSLLARALGQLNDPAGESAALTAEIEAWENLGRVAPDRVDRRRLAEALGLLAATQEGPAAGTLLQRQRAMLEALLQENPGDAGLRDQLGRLLAQLAGSTAGAGTGGDIALLKQRIGLQERAAADDPAGAAGRELASLLQEWEKAAEAQNRQDEARQARQRQLELAQAALGTGPLTVEVADLRRRVADDLAAVNPGAALARLSGLVGDLEQRIEDMVQARQNPDPFRLELVRTHARRAALSDAAGDAAGAAAADEAALPVAELLATRDPGNDETQLAFAELLVRVSGRLVARQELDAAARGYRRAREILAPMFEIRDRDERILSILASATEGAGDLALESGQTDDARVLFQELLALRSALARNAPNDRTANRNLAGARLRLGEALLQQQRNSEAEPLLRDARRALEQLGGESVRGELAIAVRLLADAASRQARVQEALDNYRQAEQLGQALRQANPGDVRWGLYLLGVYNSMAQLQSAQRDRVAAIAAGEKALTIVRELRAAGGSEAARLRADEVQILRRLSSHYAERNDSDNARRALEALATLGREELGADPNNSRAIEDLQQVLVRLGSLHAAQNRPSAALESFRQSLELLQILAARAPDNLDRQWALAGLNNQIAIAQIDMGDPVAARTHLLPAMAQLERVAQNRPSDPRIRLDLVGTYLNWIGTFGDTLANNRNEVMRVVNLAANLLDRLQDEAGLSSEQRTLVGRMVLTHQAFLERLNASRPE